MNSRGFPPYAGGEGKLSDYSSLLIRPSAPLALFSAPLALSLPLPPLFLLIFFPILNTSKPLS